MSPNAYLIMPLTQTPLDMRGLFFSNLATLGGPARPNRFTLGGPVGGS